MVSSTRPSPSVFKEEQHLALEESHLVLSHLVLTKPIRQKLCVPILQMGKLSLKELK